MTTIRAAVLEAVGGELEVQELDLAPPRAGEVQVRLLASGVCHSDLNAIDGTAETRCPAVLGHEGAGVVDAVGDGVPLPPGPPVVLSWPAARVLGRRGGGRGGECLRHLPDLCRTTWAAMAPGGLLDGTTRLSRDGEAVYHYCFLSTFAERAVVPARCCVPIPDDVPFDVAALVGCAITTGTGSVWRPAGGRPGEGVCVIGCGGVGMSAVLGAAAVGADPIVAVDLAEEKLEAALQLGATHAVEWTGGPEQTAERVRAAAGGGGDYAFEAPGRAGGGVPGWPRSWSRGRAEPR